MTASNLNIAQREEIRTHIVEVATKAFHSQGIKNVTMDDIAHSLTMSKRTLYQIFADKEELLLACIALSDEEEHRHSMEIARNTDNVLDLLLATFVCKMRELDSIAPSFFVEIAKYPRVIEYLDRKKREKEQEAVDFLTKGIEQGFFRADVNFHIVYRHLTSGMSTVVQSGLWQEYPQREIFVNTVLPFIRGCATPKGVELIDQFIEKFHHRVDF